MKTGSALLGLACLTLAACAGTPAGDGAPAVGQTNADMECRRIKTTESRLGEKVCYTKAQWAEIERREKEAADDLRDRSNTRAPEPVSGGGLGG